MKVLVCPLDWGLGHATRCIPLVRALVRNGHEVLIAATGGGRRLLAEEFPYLEVLDLPGYPIRYSRSAATLLPVLLAQLPGFLLGLRRERAEVEALVERRGIGLVISDGRYGARSRRVPSIFVTHQVHIRVPGRFPGRGLAERVLLGANLSQLRGFSEVWIPDFPGPRNLSGDLSHGPGGIPSLRFIGPLSRFLPVDSGWESPAPAALPGGAVVDVLALVSGPEPQRTAFEEILRRRLAGWTGTRVLLLGKPGATGTPSPVPPGEKAVLRLATDELNVLPHAEGLALEGLLRSATLVIARSGYTSVMEMASLGVSQAVLVPTPGQSEQEYLADHLEKSGVAQRMVQEEIDLSLAQRNAGRYRGFGDFRGDHPGTRTVSLSDFLAGHPLLRPER